MVLLQRMTFTDATADERGPALKGGRPHRRMSGYPNMVLQQLS